MKLNLTSLAAALGSVALFAPITQAVTVTSAPVGVISASLPVGTSGVSFPLLKDIFTGRIASNAAAGVTFESSAGNIGALLTSGDKYYLEIASGPLEGERFDLNTASTIGSANAAVSLDLSSASYSTSPAITTDALAGVSAIIRPHVTLAKIGASFSPTLVGNNNSALADYVQLYGPKGLAVRYLRADGLTWREVGGLVDVRSTVIPPDTSIIVTLRSGAKQWTHTGSVRINAFRKNLVSGQQSFATGFPVDLTPNQIGAFADSGIPVGQRWTGSDNAPSADTIKVYDASVGSYKSYYLRADGSSWNLVGGDGSNLAGVSVLKSPSLTLLTRVNSDPAYVIIPPITP